MTYNEAGVVNDVIVSPDRKNMTIISGDGSKKANLRSARPEGFIDEDVTRARTYSFSKTLQAGQVNRTRAIKLLGWTLYPQFNTGPPTWRLPRVYLKRDQVGAGWLRVFVCVQWKQDCD